MLSDEECRALEIPVDAHPRGRPRVSPPVKNDLSYFVRAYTPWARYALRCRSALCRVRGSDPSPDLWCLFALTYFNGEECQRLLPAAGREPPRADGSPYEYRVRDALPRPPRPVPPSTARLSDRRREAVTALLQRTGLSEEDAVGRARQLCADMRRVNLPPVAIRSFALRDGTLTSPVWFLRLLSRFESTLPASDRWTPGRITKRIGERLFFPVFAAR
jgi:hypothetical protein